MLLKLQLIDELGMENVPMSCVRHILTVDVRRSVDKDSNGAQDSTTTACTYNSINLFYECYNWLEISGFNFGFRSNSLSVGVQKQAFPHFPDGNLERSTPGPRTFRNYSYLYEKTSCLTNEATGLVEVQASSTK